MPRASRAQAEQHRAQVVDAAAGMLRGRGSERFSVPEVMAAVGLTHGGFYRQFASKDALLVEACTAAFRKRRDHLAALRDALADDRAAPDGNDGDVVGDVDDADGDAAHRAAVRRAYLEFYLSPEHRGAPAAGCPAVAVASDAARAGAGLRAAYQEGLRNMLATQEELQPATGDEATRRQDALVELALMVGAVTLARAAEGDPLSDEILGAAAAHLLATGDPGPG